MTIGRLNCALALLRVRWRLRRRGLHALIVEAHGTPLGIPATDAPIAAGREIGARVARVAALLPLRMRCAEQSLAVVILARRAGIPAELRMGARARPFSAHAWVEVGGELINSDRESVAAFRAFRELHG